jgi:hypothetical protein
LTLTNQSEIAERARAFAGLLQILNMKLSQEATEIATRDLAEIPTSVFLESCAKLRRTGTNVRNIVAAIHQEAKALAGSGNAPTRDPISQKIVCSQCAEAYWSSTSEHAPNHICDPATLAYFARGPKEQAEKQAKGLAACEGRPVKVRYPT